MNDDRNRADGHYRYLHDAKFRALVSSLRLVLQDGETVAGLHLAVEVAERVNCYWRELAGMGGAKVDIENTSKTARDNPLEILGRSMGRGAIERMERAGTQQLAASSSYLPVDGTEDRRPWELMGIVFHEVKDADPIFVRVTLPDGWKIVTTSHDMWNDLVDAEGRRRAAMFYKAAFYDRHAHVRLTRRFNVETEYLTADASMTRVVVRDSGAVVWAADSRTCVENASQEERDVYWEQSAVDEATARSWLEQRFPQWRDPLAYWQASGDCP